MKTDKQMKLAAAALKKVKHVVVPASEYKKMKARAAWEERSRKSHLQVSGKLPKAGLAMRGGCEG